VQLSNNSKGPNAMKFSGRQVVLKSITLYATDKEHNRVAGCKIKLVGPAPDDLGDATPAVRTGKLKSATVRGSTDEIIVKLRTWGAQTQFEELSQAQLVDVKITAKGDPEAGYDAKATFTIDARWRDAEQLKWFAEHIGDELELTLESAQVLLPLTAPKPEAVKRRRKLSDSNTDSGVAA